MSQHTKISNYSHFDKYGQRSYGFGVKAPVFSIYPYGTQFRQNTKPVPLCDKSSGIHKMVNHNMVHNEFNKMMRQKNDN